MTKRTTIILCAALSFMFLFSAVGYAMLTTSLYISGTAEVEIPYGLFITDITTDSTSNVDHQEVSFIKYTTTVDSTIDKKDDTTTSSSSGTPGRPQTTTTTTYQGTVTYKITVFNNTTHEYAYRGLYYQKSLNGYNGNTYVSTSNGNSKIGVVVSFDNNAAVVNPGDRITFTATYTIGKNIDDGSDWKTLLNFQFGINVESEAAARDAVHEKFLDILNTSSTYEELIDKIDDKFDGSQEWTSNYIGNVSNAVDADSMTVETLFAGQLNMIIDGEVKPASVIIKHENLDNNYMTGDDYSVTYNNSSTETTYRGCEMTLYLTTDGLSTSYGSAPVYVTVFTCDRDEDGNIVGDWYKIGDTYVGTAPIVGYKGENGGTGSFVTDDWRSTADTYSPTSNYSYSVSAGVTIKNLVQIVDSETTAAFQQLLVDGKAMIEDLTYAGTGITVVEDAYYAASPYFTLDADGNPIAKTEVTRAQLIPIMTDLDHALTKAREAIEALPASTQ